MKINEKTENFLIALAFLLMLLLVANGFNKFILVPIGAAIMIAGAVILHKHFSDDE